MAPDVRCKTLPAAVGMPRVMLPLPDFHAKSDLGPTSFPSPEIANDFPGSSWEQAS